MFKRFPQLQRRGGFYSHLAAAADPASAVYHRATRSSWVGCRFTPHPPTNTNTGVGAFGLSRDSSLLSDFSCWRLRSHCIAICFSKVQRSSNLIAAISHRVRVPGAVPTAISSQKLESSSPPKLRAKEIFVWNPSPAACSSNPPDPAVRFR